MQKILSIFIDESGDFGKYDKNAPYYLVTMLFHKQQSTIEENISTLDRALMDLGFVQPHILHTGPLIRREEYYMDQSIDERKKILNCFMHFIRKVEIKYNTFVVEKTPRFNELDLISSLSQRIRSFLFINAKYWENYDKIIVYYDNGQVQLTKILTATLADSRVTFKRISPKDYRLFQAADLITTFELIELKHKTNTNSKSEKSFFKSMRDFQKNYFRQIEKKKF